MASFFLKKTSIHNAIFYYGVDKLVRYAKLFADIFGIFPPHPADSGKRGLFMDKFLNSLMFFVFGLASALGIMALGRLVNPLTPSITATSAQKTQEAPPAWAKDYKLECTGMYDQQLCRDVTTGCQYIWKSAVNNSTPVSRLNAQGKPMCGGTS